jgi:hypothetical protein
MSNNDLWCEKCKSQHHPSEDCFTLKVSDLPPHTQGAEHFNPHTHVIEPVYYEKVYEKCPICANVGFPVGEHHSPKCRDGYIETYIPLSRRR